MSCFAQIIASNWVKFIFDLVLVSEGSFPWHTFTFLSTLEALRFRGGCQKIVIDMDININIDDIDINMDIGIGIVMNPKGLYCFSEASNIFSNKH